MQITGKTFIVTGGSSGLGQATTRQFVSAGGRVLIADVNEEAGRALAAELGDMVRFVPTDVANEAAVQNAIQIATEQLGGLHGAVSCAGIATPAKILSSRGNHTLEGFEQVVRVNLIGSFNVLRLVAEWTASNAPGDEGERGVIINTASIAAFEGQIGQVAYAASKGGIVGMMMPAARELSQHGIRVVTIAPGLFDTPLMAGLPEEARISLGQQVPFPSRLGKPEEFASLAAHIVENTMINGEVIRLDGAIRMAPR